MQVCMQCRVIGEGVHAMQGELCGCACNAVLLLHLCMQCRVSCEGVHAMQLGCSGWGVCV